MSLLHFFPVALRLFVLVTSWLSVVVGAPALSSSQLAGQYRANREINIKRITNASESAAEKDETA